MRNHYSPTFVKFNGIRKLKSVRTNCHQNTAIFMAKKMGFIKLINWMDVNFMTYLITLANTSKKYSLSLKMMIIWSKVLMILVTQILIVLAHLTLTAALLLNHLHLIKVLAIIGTEEKEKIVEPRKKNREIETNKKIAIEIRGKERNLGAEIEKKKADTIEIEAREEIDQETRKKRKKRTGIVKKKMRRKQKE